MESFIFHLSQLYIEFHLKVFIDRRSAFLAFWWKYIYEVGLKLVRSFFWRNALFRIVFSFIWPKLLWQIRFGLILAWSSWLHLTLYILMNAWRWKVGKGGIVGTRKNLYNPQKVNKIIYSILNGGNKMV